MKATWIDYLLSTVVISTILALSLFVASLSSPVARRELQDYHILAELAIGFIAYGCFSALLVWLLLWIRPISPGKYSATSTMFMYWKLITVTYRLGQGALKPFTPVFLQPLLDSMFGCRVGKDVALGGVIDDPYMISVGDGTALGTGSMVCGSFIGDGYITCGHVSIGRNVTVGPNCVIFPGVKIGDGAVVWVGSYVVPGTQILPNEVWKGNPARKWISAKGVSSHTGE